MEMAKWLVREKSTNTIYSYYTFEILLIDTAANGTDGVEIYELCKTMGKVNYYLTNIEAIRQKISSGEEAYKSWRLLNS